jgi:hypothetical protein
MWIYAIREEDGRRELVLIRCDNCGVEVKPHSEIAASGWTKNGVGDLKWHYCPRCS